MISIRDGEDLLGQIKDGKKNILFKEMTFRSQQLFANIFYLSFSFSLALSLSVTVHQILLAVILSDVPIYMNMTRSLFCYLFSERLAKLFELFLCSIIIPNYTSPCLLICNHYISDLLP